MTRLYFIRHAQSAQQLAQSDDWDSSLTDLGREQAERLAHWLAQRPVLDGRLALEVEYVGTSPLRRARETALPLSVALGRPLHDYDSLREAAFHVSDQLPSAEDPWQLPADSKPSPTYQTFREQTLAALHRLMERARQSRGAVLAITHGGVIKTALRLVLGTDSCSFRLFNTALNAVEWSSGRWRLVHLNLLDHLPPALRTT